MLLGVLASWREVVLLIEFIIFQFLSLRFRGLGLLDLDPDFGVGGGVVVGGVDDAG
jgi:hypothetical protein